jgi:hypothetical protein
MLIFLRLLFDKRHPGDHQMLVGRSGGLDGIKPMADKCTDFMCLWLSFEQCETGSG